MVRATTAKVLIRMGGAYWVNYDATSIGNMSTEAHYILDGYTHPHTLSTTGNNEIAIAVEVVMNMVAYNDWGMAGGYATGQMRPVILTTSLKDRIDRISIDSTSKGFVAGTQQAADT